MKRALKFLLFSSNAFATSYSWNTDSGNWNTGANWTPSGPPVAGDEASFGDHAATVTVTVPAAGSSATTTATFNSTTTDYTLSIASGETLTFSDTGALNAQLLLSSASRTLTVSGGAASLVMSPTNTNNLYVDSSGSGVLTLSCGITDNGTGYNLEINNASSGIVTMSGTASNVYTGSTDLIGGTLRLNKSGGAVAIPANTDMGVNSGSTLLVQASNQFGSSVNLQLLSGGTANFQTFDSALGSLAFLGGTYSQSGGTVTIGNITIQNVTLNSGAGTIALSGVDATVSFPSASGTATIAGNLNLGGSNKNFSTNNGSAAVDMLISAIIANGQLTKQGAGTLQLTGANTYTSGTIVSAGTLSIGSGGSLASTGSLNLSASGANFDISAAGSGITVGDLSGASGSTIALGSNTLTVGTATASTTFTGAMAGTSGNFTKQGSGTLILNGANTHTGTTTVSAGTLSLSTNGTIATSNLTVSGTSTFSIASGGGSKTVNNLSGDSGTNVTLGSNTLIVQSSSNTTYSGTIGGTGGLTKQGTGILSLHGTNTYSGATALSAGTIRLGSGLGNTAVTIGASGTLDGTGTIGSGSASVVNNGNIVVATSTTTGSLTINGSLTNSGTISMDIRSASDFDQIIVNTGSVSLAGTLNVAFLSGGVINSGDTITLIDNSGGSGISGTFATVNLTNFSSNPTVVYNANSVVLQFSTSTISTQTNLLPSYTSFGVPIVSQVQQIYLDFFGRFQSMRRQMRPAPAPQETALAASDLIVDGIQSPTTPLKLGTKPQNHWTVFTDLLGSLGRINTTSTRYHSLGGIAGAAYTARRYGLGLSAVYENTNGKSSGGSTFKINSIEGFFFGTFLPLADYPLFIDLIAGGAANWYKTERLTTSGTAKGHALGGQGNIYSDIGYDLTYKQADFSPYLGLGYVQSNIPAYNETGNNMALQIHAQSVKSLRTSLGFSASYELTSSNKALIPEVRGLWQREFLNHNQNVAFDSVPFGTSSQVQVFGVGRNIFFAGALIRLLAGKSFEMHTSYDYEWNSRFHSHLFMFGLQGNF